MTNFLLLKLFFLLKLEILHTTNIKFFFFGYFQIKKKSILLSIKTGLCHYLTHMYCIIILFYDYLFFFNLFYSYFIQLLDFRL